MHSDTDDPNGPGFPIRTSQDQCSVTNSPGLFAGSNVLHRLLTPRHPPHALGDLTMPTTTRLEYNTRGGSQHGSSRNEPVYMPERSRGGNYRHRTGNITWPLKTISVFNIRAQDRKKNARTLRLRTRIVIEHPEKPGRLAEANRSSQGDFPLVEDRSRRIIYPAAMSRGVAVNSVVEFQNNLV